MSPLTSRSLPLAEANQKQKSNNAAQRSQPFMEQSQAEKVGELTSMTSIVICALGVDVRVSEIIHVSHLEECLLVGGTQ